MNIDLNTAREIFVEAVGRVPPEQWEAFVSARCGEDAELRRHVQHLLQAHVEAGSFLERPALRPAGTGAYRPAAGEAPAPADDPESREPQTECREGPGTVIGPYKLVQQIGEGGMGTVYMAQQTEPVKRLVALKVIKPGMDSRQVLARFEVERQALALMDHPNIAKVLDADTTENGRPYFVMELVKGVPLTKYCDEHHLTPRERVGLFLGVCQAVQHAHHKGIIHRDLKPSNVMIALYDGQPVPKVIDFGVAKAAGQQLTEKTLVTGFGSVVGTLEYMAPEQAELNQLDIDTRSDIYSLGVLLYELLTGTTPLERKRLKEVSLLEVLRLIREEEPPRPSTRLSTTEELPAIAANRGLEPKRLSGLVRGELDWVVMKCLEKDRNRRYETANGLAMDLQRYLHDEPVLACPPSAAYRLRKFARRNKRALAMAALLGVMLLAAVLVLVVSNVRISGEEKAKDRALQQAQEEEKAKDRALQQAQKNAETAKTERQEAEERLKLVFEALDEVYLKEVEKRLAIYQQAERQLVQNPDREKLDRDFLEKGVKFYEKLAQRQSTGSAARFETAKAYCRVAHTQLVLRHLKESEKAYRAALQLYGKLAEEYPAVPAYALAYADTYHWLYRPFMDSNRLQPAEQITREALALFERLTVQFPRHSRSWAGVAACHINLAQVLAVAGRLPEAEQHYRQSEALYSKLSKEPAGAGVHASALAEAFDGHGQSLMQAGHTQDAIARWREAQAIWEKLVAAAPQDANRRWRLGVRLENLGYLYVKTGRFQEAEGAHSQALPIWEQLVPELKLPDHRYHLGCNRKALGYVYHQTGRFKEAERAYQAALPVWEKLVVEFNQPDHRGHLVATRIYLAQVLVQLAEQVEKDATLSDADRKAAAQAYLERVKKLRQEAAQMALAAADAEALNNLVWPLVAAASSRLLDPAPAVELASKAVALKPDAAHIWNTLGVAYYRAGNWKAAIAPLKKSSELSCGGYFSADGFFLAMAHWQMGEKERARKYFAAADLWVKKYSPNNEERRRFRSEAAALLGLPENAPAVPPPQGQDDPQLYTLLLDATPDAAWVHFLRGQLYERKGEPQKAQADYRQALDLYTRALEADAEQAIFWRARAQVHGDLGQWGRAIQDFSKAIELKPDDALTWNLRGVAYYRLGQWDKAVADHSKVIEMKPEVSLYRSNRGSSYMRLRQWDRALADFTKAIELQPNSWARWADRGNAHAEAEQWDKAASDFGKAVELKAGPEIWNRHALALLAANDLGGYRKACAGLLERSGKAQDPQQAEWAARACGLAPGAVADPGQVVRLIKKPAADNPNSYLYARTYGMALLRAGKLDEAVLELERAASLRRQESPGVWLPLALAHHHLGHAAESRRWLERAVKWIDCGSRCRPADDPLAWDRLPWQERLGLQTLRREAEGLIRGAPGGKDQK